MTQRLPQVEQRYYVDRLQDATVFEHSVVLNGQTLVARYSENPDERKYGGPPPSYRERHIKQMLMSAIEKQIYGGRS